MVLFIDTRDLQSILKSRVLTVRSSRNSCTLSKIMETTLFYSLLLSQIELSGATVTLLENCDILDLSYDYNQETVYWPGAGAFQLTQVFEGFTEKGYYYLSNNLSTPEHGGTHMDAPIHFSENRNTAEKVKLKEVVGEACVINVTAKSYRNSDYQLSIEDVKSWEVENGKLDSSCVLILKTGWEEFWPDRKKYLGTSGTDTSRLHFPGIHPNTSLWLTKHRKIRAVGLDTASIDYGQSTLFQSHQVLFKENIPAFENLRNLKRLPARGSTVILLPMKVEGGSGAPVRGMAVGWNGPDDPCRRSGSNVFPSSAVLFLMYFCYYSLSLSQA